MLRFTRASLALTALTLLAGCGMPSFLVTPVANSHELNEEVVQPGKGFLEPKIAVIQIEGMLINAKSGGFLKPTENDLSLFAQELEKAEQDPRVKAVVLRVNSPGGTVTTSDTMYQMLMRFKEKTHKPVIAATQEICASGGYYVSCAADQIVVHPTSVVGSIGVIFNTLEFKDGLDHLGIHADAIHSGPLKEMGSPFKHATAQERAVMQEMVDEYFKRFYTVVSTRRPVKEPVPQGPLPANYAGIYSGRVFSGQKAVELGLADRTGLLQDALDIAREMAHCPDAEAVMYRRPYGYSGSIYANSSVRDESGSNVLQLTLPGASSLLPSGFYYLWQP